jgi:hypothetical protein
MCCDMASDARPFDGASTRAPFDDGFGTALSEDAPKRLLLSLVVCLRSLAVLGHCRCSVPDIVARFALDGTLCFGRRAGKDRAACGRFRIAYVDEGEDRRDQGQARPPPTRGSRSFRDHLPNTAGVWTRKKGTLHGTSSKGTL